MEERRLLFAVLGEQIMGKNKAPKAPDYTAAAQATAQGNLDASRAALSGSLINQYTPEGSLQYQQRGTDQFGNPQYSAYQTYSPAQQAIADQENKLNAGLLSTANTGLTYANDVLSKPGVDTSKLPSTGIDPGQQYQDAIMKRLQPQIEGGRNMLENKLTNQGIMQGSEAWNNAISGNDKANNDLLTSATINGMGMGLNANQQAFQQQAYNQMQPINVINALRTGSQVSAPNYVNTPGQATTQGADLLGAAQAQYNASLGATNAQNAASGNLMNGLFGLGGAYLGRA
jgi:hypothetical protein